MKSSGYCFQMCSSMKEVLMKVLIGLAASAMLALTVWSAVQADGAVAAGVRQVKEPTPQDTRPPPQMTLGVIQCGEVIAMWVILEDGSVFRTDALHHPDTPQEYNAFLAWAAHPTANHGEPDIYEIPCPNEKK